MSESFHSNVLNLFSVISHATILEVSRFSGAAHSLDVHPLEPEGSSSPGCQEVHEPHRNRDVAHDLCSDPGGEVSQLALCLDAVQTALATSEWETTDARAVATDAQARMIGKVSFIEKLCPNVHGLVLMVFSVVSPGGVGRSSRAGPCHRQGHEHRGCPAWDCLWAMPAQVRMVALSGVRHGATLALAIA